MNAGRPKCPSCQRSHPPPCDPKVSADRDRVRLEKERTKAENRAKQAAKEQIAQQKRDANNKHKADRKAADVRAAEAANRQYYQMTPPWLQKKFVRENALLIAAAEAEASKPPLKRKPAPPSDDENAEADSDIRVKSTKKAKVDDSLAEANELILEALGRGEMTFERAAEIMRDSDDRRKFVLKEKARARTGPKLPNRNKI